MKTKLVHMAAVVALTLTACSQDEVQKTLEKTPVSMTFTADIKLGVWWKSASNGLKTPLKRKSQEKTK